MPLALAFRDHETERVCGNRPTTIFQSLSYVAEEARRRENRSGGWPDSAAGSWSGVSVLNYYRKSIGLRQAASACDLKHFQLSHGAEDLIARFSCRLHSTIVPVLAPTDLVGHASTAGTLR